MNPPYRTCRLAAQTQVHHARRRSATRRTSSVVGGRLEGDPWHEVASRSMAPSTSTGLHWPVINKGHTIKHAGRVREEIVTSDV